MKLNYFTNFVMEKMTHLDKGSPNFLIRLPLKENLLSILKAQIHTFLNTTHFFGYHPYFVCLVL